MGGNLNLFMNLVNKGLDIKDVRNDKFTILHSAAAGGNFSIVRYLIDNGINVNSLTTSGFSPLMIALQTNQLAIAKLLVESGADVNQVAGNGASIIYSAIYSKNPKCVHYALKRDIDPNSTRNDGVSALQVAVEGNQIGIVKEMLSPLWKVNVNIKNSENFTPLHISCINGLKEITEMLINAGADISNADCGFPPIYYAALGGNSEVFKLFDITKIDLNAKYSSDNTILHAAAQSGNIEIIERVVTPENISMVTKDGDTPAHFAILSKNLKCLQYLVEKGADLNVFNEGHIGLLYSSAYYGAEEIFNYLLDAGLDATELTSFGGNLFHAAANGGNICILKRVSTFDINVNAIDILGRKPISFAKTEEVKEFLINAGSN